MGMALTASPSARCGCARSIWSMVGRNSASTFIVSFTGTSSIGPLPFVQAHRRQHQQAVLSRVRLEQRLARDQQPDPGLLVLGGDDGADLLVGAVPDRKRVGSGKGGVVSVSTGGG